MKKILTTLIGTSLLAGALYASENIKIDHSKMTMSQSECQAMMKTQKKINNMDEQKTSKSGLDLLLERYSNDDPFGGG
jgi:hypothetical protein